MPPISTKTEKPRDAKKAVTRIMSYLASSRALLACAVLLAIAGNILALIGPGLSGKAIDIIAAGKGNVNIPKVFYYAGLMLVFYFASAIMSYTLSVLMVRAARRMAGEMRQEVFNKLI